MIRESVTFLCVHLGRRERHKYLEGPRAIWPILSGRFHGEHGISKSVWIIGGKGLVVTVPCVRNAVPLQDLILREQMKYQASKPVMGRKKAGHMEDRKEVSFHGFPGNIYERDNEELGHDCKEKKQLNLGQWWSWKAVHRLRRRWIPEDLDLS